MRPRYRIIPVTCRHGHQTTGEVRGVFAIVPGLILTGDVLAKVKRHQRDGVVCSSSGARIVVPDPSQADVLS